MGETEAKGGPWEAVTHRKPFSAVAANMLSHNGLPQPSAAEETAHPNRGPVRRTARMALEPGATHGDPGRTQYTRINPIRLRRK
jgi:hypothetical protein